MHQLKFYAHQGRYTHYYSLRLLRANKVLNGTSRENAHALMQFILDSELCLAQEHFARFSINASIAFNNSVFHKLNPKIPRLEYFYGRFYYYYDGNVTLGHST